MAETRPCRQTNIIMSTIQTLSIDLETRSSADISKSGVYRYAEDPGFDILLFGVSENSGPVTVYDLACGIKLPERILNALTNPNVTKYAYNASFERVCLSYWFRRYYPDLLKDSFLSPDSWRCTMVWAAYNGLPMSLAQVGAVLKLDQQKMSEGKNLIRYFCIPSSVQDAAVFHSPADDPEKWELFKAYNRRDVETELAIQARLEKYPVPESVWHEYHLDQAINDRGIRIDSDLVRKAIKMDERSHEQNTAALQKLTGLENPNSVSQMKEYLTQNGLIMESIGKKEVKSALPDAPEAVREVLELRLQSAKSSIRKYEAMRNAVCNDGRCRGMFQFYGANRTGRWAGRLVQLQNLPQNKIENLDRARDLLKAGDYETLELLYDSVPQILSELIRTAFIPAEGKKFIVADYSAIEARVLAHLAGETWREKVFAEGGDIYCASASQMFHIPVEKHGINGHLRQKGKIAELALGYGGGVGALTSMGALDMGVKEEELQPLVSMWREANPNIVGYWWQIDAAAKSVIKDHVPMDVGSLRFEYRSGMLFIELPSGRRLSYVKPRICENRYGGEGISYMGLTSQKKWERIETYGPKLVENITQAISRDILANAMRNLSFHDIVGHIHDELIIETEQETAEETICILMSDPPAWMEDLKLKAEGYECNTYRKE